MSDTPAIGEQQLSKAFSCARCFERKVRCDKRNPCSNCVKSKVECIFRIPPAPRRRKKRTQEDILLARLRKCEELLKSKGIDIDSPTTSTQPASSSSPGTQPTSQQVTPDSQTARVIWSTDIDRKTPGQLIVDQGKSRFIENNLWASLSDEFRQPNEAIAEYSEDDDEIGSPIDENADFILGYTPSANSIPQLHPSPTNIFILWQMFLDNINPMTKLVHRPTLQKTLVQASAQLDNLPRGLEALMFAIYSSAVYSIDNDECEMKLGESRKVLLARYQYATRKALARARFMGTSELVVLQAFCLYLITMREDYDSRTTWTLAGVASRVGQCMGIHRDGTSLGVSPFETEMRRRLWWQISILDGRSAELSGSGRSSDYSLADTLVPTNVDDEDLYPDMEGTANSSNKAYRDDLDPPPVRTWHRLAEEKRREFGHSFENLRLASPWTSSLEERDAFIDEMEQRLEDKFLKYCDPSVPIQFMSIIQGRGAINFLRLMAHHPRKWGPREEVPSAEREYLWKVSIKVVEGFNMAHSSKPLQRFMWHTRVHFVWQAFIYVLNELKERTLGDEIDRAWQEVDELYRHYPHFVTNYKKPLHFAIGSLCLKAYAAREKALRDSTNGVFPKVIPEYIQQLREQRENGPLQHSTTTFARKSVATAEDAGNSVESNQDHISTAMGWENAPPLTQSTSQTTSGSYKNAPFPIIGLQGGSGAYNQFSLPAFPPLPILGDGLISPSEPSLAHDLAMADVPMDWAHWNYIIQDFGGSMPR